jgi:hypothetical protein
MHSLKTAIAFFAIAGLVLAVDGSMYNGLSPRDLYEREVDELADALYRRATKAPAKMGGVS